MQSRFENAALDMRRKNRRALVAKVLDAADHLPKEDRQLLIAIYGRGMSVTDAAVMLGTPERQLRRRVKALVRRVCDPAFHAAVKLGPELPRPICQAARLTIIEGLPVRQAALRLGASYYSVRKHREAFLNMATAAGLLAPPPPKGAPA